MLLALICYRNCFSYDLELQEMWRCSKPDAKMTFFIIYSICQLIHKPTHLYNQVGQNLFGIMLIKNISHMLCIMPLHLYNRDRVHPSSHFPHLPSGNQGLAIQPEVECFLCSINSCGSTAKPSPGLPSVSACCFI